MAGSMLLPCLIDGEIKMLSRRGIADHLNQSKSNTFRKINDAKDFGMEGTEIFEYVKKKHARAQQKTYNKKSTQRIVYGETRVVKAEESFFDKNRWIFDHFILGVGTYAN